MNIFYLSSNVKECALSHNDKHVVKMIVEYAQMLSTSHRILDGELTIQIKNGKKAKRYKLSDERDNILYNVTHAQHPCNVWVRESLSNYNYLYNLLDELLKEYTFRYGRMHRTSELMFLLQTPPKNLKDNGFTTPPQAMPEYCKDENTVNAYRNYYKLEKQNLKKYKLRNIPEWY